MREKLKERKLNQETALKGCVTRQGGDNRGGVKKNKRKTL